eukprot:Lankesteria_metandrocarpae@DN5405_c0_g2_i2.p2
MGRVQLVFPTIMFTVLEALNLPAKFPTKLRPGLRFPSAAVLLEAGSEEDSQHREWCVEFSRGHMGPLAAKRSPEVVERFRVMGRARYNEVLDVLMKAHTNAPTCCGGEQVDQ